ncbi:hypothetical protein PFICI_12813 [Pestalotiopsis fici W106-1]|uniref:Uncharacterized protein n=1 Tax=Pestalotiopsis fici (strain W106-1 / CGMCC3.15140) TaxID=1229662 RepID=W3WPZ7_PESFW|nr:uncharacterized protein PFICI_12813 [Pestalotiopsis fici W106-1]ETS75869.1 hypothetical protein PFICI_12813 [Pestalotiopsis fici W106-1]
MDGVSAAASAIAIVQAAGMLHVVGKSFWDTFISKDNEDRGGDATARVASIDEFIQKIKLLQFATAATPPAPPEGGGGPAVLANAVTVSGLGGTLTQCEAQLASLRKKVAKMTLPAGVNKWKRFVATVRIKLNETEFPHLESTIGTLLTQLELIISLAHYELHERSQKAQAEAAQILQRLEQRQQEDRIQVFDQHTASLAVIQNTLEQSGVQLGKQEQIFQESHDIIIKALEKLTISPRLDRTASELSGTTAGTVAVETMEVDDDDDDDNDAVVPVAPGLILHPGFNFRDDRLEGAAEIAKPTLDLIGRWLDPSSVDVSRVYIHASKDDDATHDLCNRVVYELAMANSSRLLCYNGLPREGSPPADGWYTMTHLIWWLSAQMLIAMPHLDGHMPASGYDPDVPSLVEKLQKVPDDGPAYVVLYLPGESCHGDSDRKLYYSLVASMCGISSTRVRLLLFSDGKDCEVMNLFGTNKLVIDNVTRQDKMSLDDWMPPNIG